MLTPVCTSGRVAGELLFSIVPKRGKRVFFTCGTSFENP